MSILNQLLKNKDYKNVQVQVPIDLACEVQRILDKHDLTWKSVIVASLENFVDETNEVEFQPEES